MALMDRQLGAVKRCIGFMQCDRGDAEDLAQEVVLKAWRFLSGFRAESSFRFQKLWNPDTLASLQNSEPLVINGGYPVMQPER